MASDNRGSTESLDKESCTVCKIKVKSNDQAVQCRVQNGSPGSTRFYGPVHLRRYWSVPVSTGPSVYTREASEIFKLSGC